MSILQNIIIQGKEVEAECFYCRCRMSFEIPVEKKSFKIQCPDCQAIYRYKDTDFEKEIQSVQQVVKELSRSENKELQTLIKDYEGCKFATRADFELRMSIESNKNQKLFIEYLIENQKWDDYDIALKCFSKNL